MSGYPSQGPPQGFKPGPYGAPQPGVPYRPQQPPPSGGGGSSGCWIAAIIVAVVVGIPVILGCAGLGFFIFFVGSTIKKVDNKIREEQARIEQNVKAAFPEEKPITNVDEAITALNTDHFNIPEKGADWLIAHPVEAGKRAAVVQALEPKLVGFNGSLNAKCVKAIGIWGTKENAPAVAKCLHSFGDVRVPACEVLGKWKDPSVAADLVLLLDDRGAEGQAAENALVQIGSGCDAAVRTQLDLDRRTAHTRAERILAGYGVDVQDAMITARVNVIRSVERHNKREAIISLAALPLKPARQNDVARAFDAALAENDVSTRDEILKGLMTWGDKESATAVAKFIKSEGFPNKHAVEFLASRKEPDTFDAIAGLMDNAFMPDSEFNRVFMAFGAEAEKAAVASLHDERRRARDRARAILAELKVKPDALLTQTLKDISSTNHERVKSAVQWLATATIDNARKKEVSAKLGVVARDNSTFSQGEAIETLVKLNDPTSAGVILDLVRENSTQSRVTGALSKAGPAAEDLVLGMLDSSDPEVIRFACLALGRGSGTQKSIKPLQAVLRKAGAASNRQLTAIARSALEAVQKREGTGTQSK